MVGYERELEYQLTRYRRSVVITPFKVTDLGTNRKPVCDFLLVK